MPRMNRPLYGFALAAVVALLVPVTAAAASPSPSPTLDQVLVAPPAGFIELTSGTFDGAFTAHDYATNTGASNASEIEATLNHDGFVGGYGKTWEQQSTSHVIIEGVIAFSGGKGARDWLTAAEAGDKADPSYQHPDTVTGIEPYYGVHFLNTSSNVVADGFVFAKGNDVFSIAAASLKDDVLSLATAQTTAQFTSAPNETIPSSQWPENQTSSSSSGGLGATFFVLAAIVIVVVIVLVVVLRSRRRAPAAAIYGAGMYGPPPGGLPAGGMPPTVGPPMQGMPIAAAPVVSQPVAPPIGVQLSPDLQYWWDGQAWKDTMVEAPPSAQRSSDGVFWWDGHTWRPVPQQPPG
jgi:hypothetical protein